MYKCYSDSMGNFPCDYGMLCDKCLYMDVQQIDCAEMEEDEEIVVTLCKNY